MKKLVAAGLLCAFLMGGIPAKADAYTVVVDAGHGGWDPGAVGNGGLREKDVTLDLADQLKAELIHRGYDVAMTRTSDTYVPLDQRVDISEKDGGDLFVSIHCNWNDNPSIVGTQVLYYDSRYPVARYPASAEMTKLTPESKRLAAIMLNDVTGAAGTEDRGLIPSRVYVVRSGSMPSVLVETAFLSNRYEEAELADPAFRQKLVKGIADGIEQYAPLVFADIRGHWASDSIVRLKNMGIVSGYGSRFLPEAPISRAEFAAMLHRLADAGHIPEPPQPDAVPEAFAAGDSATVTSDTYQSDADPLPAMHFADVSPANWAYDDISYAYKAGWIQGYANGTFRPGQAMTREEMATLLTRILPLDGSYAAGSVQPFEDVAADRWSATAIAAVKSVGLITGETGTLFAPDRPVTRAECAVILDRYLHRASTLLATR